MQLSGGGYSETLPDPITRLDRFMVYAAGVYSETLPEPITRLEKYWANICGVYEFDIPVPITREEYLLSQISGKDATASGTVIELADSAEEALDSLTLYGWSTQDGEPSPDNPIDVVSAADSGEVTVTLSDGDSQSQTLVLSVLNGLPGIPVPSGGNYTDENGQMWVADKIVLNSDGSGTYIQNIGVLEFDENTADVGWSITYTLYMYVAYINSIDAGELLENTYCYCNYFVNMPIITNTTQAQRQGKIKVFEHRVAIGYDGNEGGADNFNAWVAEKYDEGKPLTIWYPLVTPIETEMTAEEISAFLALKTYEGTTAISNDAGAYMEVGYKKT